MVRQQTWQKIINSVVAAGLEMWESRRRFPSLAWCTGFKAFQKVYLCTSDQLAETGGENPHKMKSPQTPFRTT
jgi:hypothetical protein